MKIGAESFDEAVKQVMAEFGIPKGLSQDYATILLREASRRGLLEISPSSAVFGNSAPDDTPEIAAKIEAGMKSNNRGRQKFEEFGAVPIIYGLVTNEQGLLQIHPMYRLVSRDSKLEKLRKGAVYMMEDGMRQRQRIALRNEEPDPIAPNEISNR